MIGRYDLTGTVTGGDLSGLVVTPVSRAIQSAYPRSTASPIFTERSPLTDR